MGGGGQHFSSPAIRTNTSRATLTIGDTNSSMPLVVTAIISSIIVRPREVGVRVKEQGHSVYQNPLFGRF